MPSIDKTVGASWEHWDYGRMEVLWMGDYIQISIGHPDYKFRFEIERAQEFISTIRTAVNKKAYGILYDNSETRGPRIKVDAPHLNDSQENELFYNEYYLQIIKRKGDRNGFWLERDCLLRIADEIENLINHDHVNAIMSM